MATMSPQSHCRCWAEVDLDGLRCNVAAIRRRIGRAKLMAVVKADAYGHGLAPVARTLRQCDVDAFAVANLTEALALRKIVDPDPIILQFGAPFPFEIDAMLAHNITPTISSLDEAQRFEQVANQQVAVHVEIDTGMGRCGFWHAETAAALRQLATFQHLQIAGVYTHFPSADENLTETRRQLADFLAVAHGYPLLHAANSAALLN